MEAKEELQSLNKERRKLIHNIFRVKKHHEELMSRVQQDVSSYLEDHAEKYFALDNAEFKNQTFAKRYDASLKAMKIELRQLEETIGINLHDMDEELDRAVSKLAQKEKEFDGLEETLRMPIKETAEYTELIQKFLNHNPSINMDNEYQRLQARLSLHRQFEDDFLSVIAKREKQLEKEIEIMKRGGENKTNNSSTSSNTTAAVAAGPGGVSAKPRSTLLEQVALSTAKELQAKRSAYREQIDYELDSLLKDWGEEMAEMHEGYLGRYRQLIGKTDIDGVALAAAGVDAEKRLGSMVGRLGVSVGGRVGPGSSNPPPPSAVPQQSKEEKKVGNKGTAKGKGSKKNDVDVVAVESEVKEEVVKLPPAPPHWKSELLDEQRKRLDKARELREKAHEQDALLVKALERRPQSTADPAILLDLSQKLASLYSKYNTSMLEAARNSHNNAPTASASSPIPTLFGHVYVTPSKGGGDRRGVAGGEGGNRNELANTSGGSGNRGESKLSSLFS